MKKVGIITIHNSPNYGACLQSFALYKYILSRGCDCEIIDLHRPFQEDYVPSKKFKPYSAVQASFKHRVRMLVDKCIRSNKRPSYYFSLAKDKFDKFNAQVKMSRAYCGIDELYGNPPKYDLYITGSDQVWNPTQPYCMEPYFLTFVNDGAPKISYAASVGLTSLPIDVKKDFKKWLASYDAISVREKQAKVLLESFTDYDIKVVADPVFLIDVDFWKSIAVTPESEQPYILLFTLQYNKALLDFALRLKQESGIQLVYLEHKQPEAPVGEYVPITDAGPREFLGYISNAEMVITTSFHCTAFSLIMKVANFCTYIAPDNPRGSRITDLLDTYSLTDHIINNLEVSYAQLKSREISWDSVFNRMKREQQNSRDFIDRYLRCDDSHHMEES